LDAIKEPNLDQYLGAVTNPHWIVLDWVQNGEVMDCLRKNPDASLVDLVVFHVPQNQLPRATWQNCQQHATTGILDPISPDKLWLRTTNGFGRTSATPLTKAKLFVSCLRSWRIRRAGVISRIWNSSTPGYASRFWMA